MFEIEDFFRTPMERPNSFFDGMKNGFNMMADMNRMTADVAETETAYEVTVDVPASTKDEIQVSTDNGILTVAVSKEKETKDEEKKYIRRERVSTSMKRQFKFSNVKEDEIEASFENGVLKIILPKREAEETKKSIEIK